MTKFYLKTFLAAIFAAITLFSVQIPAYAALGSSCPTNLKPGDMVKVAGKPAIYLINKDSKLLYFPDGDVFKSWHAKYGGYISIDQTCLDSIPVPNTYPAGVNFKPGSYIVRQESSSQLYTIPTEDTLAKISPATAAALYGSGYKVMVIKNIFWPNYVYRAPDIAEVSPPPAPSPVPATGNIYYVSTSGKNSNSGSATSPWASPAYGADKLKPGDTLIIKSGTYYLNDYGNDMLVPPSGAANNYVTIKGESAANRPILKAGNNMFAAISISNKSYVKIADLEITSNNGQDFRDGINGAEGPANHIILENLYIHHLDEYGINIGDTNDLKITNCVISYTGYGAIGGPAGTNGGWKNVVISGTTMSYSGHYYQGGPGPSPYDRPDGFGIETSAGPIEIANSISEHNKGDGIDSKAENTNVHDTVIRNNSSDGLKLWGTGSKATNVLIYGRGDGNSNITPWASIVLQSDKANAVFTLDHVTVDDYLGGNYLMHVQYDNQNTPTTLTIKNSIFSSRGPNASPIFIAPGTNFTVSNSDFYFPGSDNVLEHGDTAYTSSQINTFGSGNIYGDPKFVSPAWGSNGNYRLQSGSPATGMGTNTF
ncbi:MAG: right-handed parallel beta-helix repeat-containing protein [Patescibacteria group bacterium]